MQSRFKSWALWLSVAGLLFIMLTEVFGIAIDGAVWDKVLTSTGIVLAGFGVVNNPTNKTGI